jgi:hypothetical protein
MARIEAECGRGARVASTQQVHKRMCCHSFRRDTRAAKPATAEIVWDEVICAIDLDWRRAPHSEDGQFAHGIAACMPQTVAKA